MRVALILSLLPLPALAETVICTATQQCRGDAQRMCAPSSLQVRIEDGPVLWIDRQGPYPATRMADTLVVPALGPDYRLERGGDGSFIWYGNRGKRFLGTCVVSG